MMQPTQRHAYIDWLRIIAIMGVLFFHSAMPFVAEWEWHIKNKETSNLLLEFNFFLSRFRMPLLFFISGAVTHVMLQKRSAGQFIGLRFKRLFIPLLFGVLLIVPIQVYMERVSQGFKGNFIDFYPSIFSTGTYPEGNFSWHHLWFIAYLFVYDVLFAPIFKWIVTKRPAEKFLRKIAQGKRIFLLMIPSVIAFSATVMFFPETHDLINDWCRIFYWLFFLLAGFLCMHLPAMMESLERNRRISLTIGISTIFIINYLRWNQVEPFDVFADYQNQWQTYLYLALFAITAWCLVFAAVGYGKKYLNKKLPILNYLNGAVYPFYILHQTVIVVLVFYIVQTSDEILLKYSFTVIATFFICMAIYHVFIRPFAVLRFLFGAKKDKKEKSENLIVANPKPETLKTVLEI